MDTTMHSNAKVLHQLFTGLNRRESEAMVRCYHQDATFHDIAFDLHGRDEIFAMWQMICNGDIRATFDVVRADDREGVVKVIDEYSFTETGRRVRNPIESRFRFRDGLIIEQVDSCDARAWAAAALGAVTGFLAGRFRFLRAWKARGMLKPYLQANRVEIDEPVRSTDPVRRG
jgi:ketosteroid isomerase-like protein